MIFLNFLKPGVRIVGNVTPIGAAWRF